MPSYTASGMFDATGTNTDSYRLDIEARTSAATGGTLVEIFASVTKTRTHGSVDTTSTSGSRSWSLPGGRLTSTSGTLDQSGSSAWSYTFPAASTNTVNVYNYFNRYVPYSYGSSTTLTITVAGSGSSFLTSRTLSVSVPLFAEPTPAPTAPTSLSASTNSSDGVNLSWSGATGSITNYGIWWNFSASGAPSSGSSPDFTTSSTSYTDTGLAQDSARYYWVRAQGPGGNSAWYPAGDGVYGFRTLPQSRYYFAGEGADYLSYSDSGLYNNGSTIYLPYASRTGYTFGGWWTGQNSSGTYIGPMGGAFTVGSYTSGTTFYAYWYATQYTLNYDANGGTVSPSSKTVTYNSPYGTLATPTRSGYSFNGWFTATTGGTQVTSVTTYAIASDSTIFAQWTAQIPVFSDQEITTTGVLRKDINTNIDYTVSAAPVTSFSIVYSGTGLDPTSWLTITKESGTNNGILAGKPTQIGTYTFIVRATNSGGGDTDSSLITLVVSPAGKRFTASGTTQLSVAKRFDGTNWVNLKIMRRFDGTAWQDIGNI